MTVVGGVEHPQAPGMIRERGDPGPGIAHHHHLDAGTLSEMCPGVAAPKPQQRAIHRVVAAVVWHRAGNSPKALQRAVDPRRHRRIEQHRSDHVGRRSLAAIPGGDQLGDHRTALAETHQPHRTLPLGDSGQVGVEGGCGP